MSRPEILSRELRHYYFIEASLHTSLSREMLHYFGITCQKRNFTMMAAMAEDISSRPRYIKQSTHFIFICRPRALTNAYYLLAGIDKGYSRRIFTAIYYADASSMPNGFISSLYELRQFSASVRRCLRFTRLLVSHEHSILLRRITGRLHVEYRRFRAS
jgi:hypothetical protein